MHPERGRPKRGEPRVGTCRSFLIQEPRRVGPSQKLWEAEPHWLRRPTGLAGSRRCDEKRKYIWQRDFTCWNPSSQLRITGLIQRRLFPSIPGDFVYLSVILVIEREKENSRGPSRRWRDDNIGNYGRLRLRCGI